MPATMLELRTFMLSPALRAWDTLQYIVPETRVICSLFPLDWMEALLLAAIRTYLLLSSLTAASLLALVAMVQPEYRRRPLLTLTDFPELSVTVTVPL